VFGNGKIGLFSKVAILMWVYPLVGSAIGFILGVLVAKLI
jgi:hypothetical protein